MSRNYELRITRAIDWRANDHQQIEVAEWLAVAGGDAELTADPGNGPYAMRYRTSGWFDWCEGNVYTSNPDRTTVTKMLALAKQLDGILQGDDGEVYESAQQWPGARPAAEG